MQRYRTFWLLNTLGWATVWLGNVGLRYLINPRFDGSKELGHSALLVLVGWLVTGAVRWHWKKHRLLGYGVARVLLYGFGLALMASMVHVMIVLGMIYWWESGQTRTQLSWLSMFLANWSNLFFIHMIWMALYISIQYIRRAQQLRLERLALEKALNEARLNSLMGQLNPHYLFNGLNNIRALMLEDVPKARAMLSSLSANLRYALNANQVKFVPLSTELEMVAHFIALSRIQLEDRLRYEQTVEAGLDNVLVPPMLLQLLVENAIKHGISPLVEGGLLSVAVAKNDQLLHLTVTNDYAPHLAQASQTSTQIGLRNLQERLQLLYSDRATMTYDAQSTQVQVHIRLPLTPTL